MPFKKIRILKDLKDEYSGPVKALIDLYRTYRFSTLLVSPFLHLSLVFALITWDIAKPLEFIETGLILLAIFISFSSASFAVFMALNNEQFVAFQLKMAEAENNEVDSILSRAVQTTFIHFVLVQSVALFVLMLFKFNGQAINCYSPYFSFFAYLLFMYSISLNFAVIYHLYEFTKLWFHWVNFKNSGHE